MDSRPKCVRVMVTAIYADNSSVMLDVKEPTHFEWEMNDRNLDVVPIHVGDFTMMPAGEVSLSVDISTSQPMLISVYPVKERNGRLDY